jgi:hypothetical protein
MISSHLIPLKFEGKQNLVNNENQMKYCIPFSPIFKNKKLEHHTIMISLIFVVLTLRA